MPFWAFALVVTPPALVPKPYESSFQGRAFHFSSHTRLVNKGGSLAPKVLDQMLKRAAGFTMKHATQGGDVVFRQKSDTRQKLRPDWYWLTVTDKQILVEYSNETGAFYAVQTLRQLLPPQIESAKPQKGIDWSVPGCTITDGPRFPWRGMLLDCSRHFFPIDYVKKTIDRLAMMKMNVLHWHLVDDGGWRIEIKKFPRLTSIGAWREDTGEVWPGGRWNYANIRFVGDGKAPGSVPNVKRYGGYYTQAQIKDVVKYAADRHITIVPEIELPGHSLGAIVSYPELGCHNVPPADKQGKSVSNVYCAGSDETIKFIEDVLDETLKLFPSTFIHIGADEVLKDYWHNCDRCQSRMKKEGLKDEAELQSWMVKHFDNYLTNHGRRLVGWDEILEGGLAKGATVMSWRGTDGGIAAAKAGRDVVMTPTSHCYFDYSFQAIDSRHVLAWDPVPSVLDQSEASHIMGGQFNMWTEWIGTTARLEELQFPRAFAMSEVLWSPAGEKDFADYSRREAALLARLDMLGANYHLPAPQVEYNLLFTTGNDTRVTANPVAGTPFKLRYTTDGTVPNLKSREYTGPVHVDKAAHLTFAYVTPKGTVSDTARVECRPYESMVRGNLEPGLAGTTYLLSGEPSKMPDLSRAEVHGSFEADAIDESARPRASKFAVSWGGFIKVPVTGAYTFSLTSDDGSMLWLNNALVVDNDGPHGAVEKRGTAWLQAGTYQLRVQWFDQGGGNSLKVAMQSPGGSIGPVPTDWLWRPTLP